MYAVMLSSFLLADVLWQNLLLVSSLFETCHCLVFRLGSTCEVNWL